MSQRTRAATLLLLAATIGIATAATAQPRGRGRKPKPPPAEPAPSAEPAKAEEAKAVEAPAADAGAPAYAAPLEAPDGGRLSPLTPAPAEMPGPMPSAAPPLDYDKLLGDVAALRARVAAVADVLLESRMRITLKTDGDRSSIGRLVVSLDDGAVYTAPQPFRADDAVTVYEHAVAPGKHAVTVELERRDDRDESFRSAQRSRFVVDVPKDNRLDVDLRVGDDSSMGHDFPGDKSGKYDLRVRLEARAKPTKR